MEIGPKMFKTDDDRAVSPVIGVILMVAITVILAAVIAAFVLGIGPGDEPVDGAVDVSVSADGTSVDLEVVDDGNLQNLELGGCESDDLTAWDSADSISTGDTETDVDISGCDDGQTVNIIGEGPDGGEEVVGSATV